MNITNIQSIIAPILAPVAPAILFGNNLHAGMIADNVHPVIAGFGAVLGTGGVELSGALACSMAVMAYHRKDYKIMTVSIIASIVYAIFVMVGIMQARNTATFAGAVIISLVAYLMQGVWQSYTNKLRVEQAETDMQAKLLKLETNKINAQTRNAKVGTVMSSVNLTPLTFTSEKVKRVQAYWKDHPLASLRDCAEACECSHETARKWKT
jgi:hypothetical protein